MGLDLYIERRKKNDPNAPWEELFYARKFWELLDADFVKEYNDSKNFCYVEVRINSEEDFDELINIAAHNRNYSNNRILFFQEYVKSLHQVPGDSQFQDYAIK